MEYLIGSLVAAAVCVFALLTQFDRDRAFYPTVVIVVATYYILFAAMADSTAAVTTESLVAGAFVVLAWAAFKKSRWLAVAGLTGHGVFDLFHRVLIPNPGVPPWWPGFCSSFDILAGVFLAVVLVSRPEPSVHPKTIDLPPGHSIS